MPKLPITLSNNSPLPFPLNIGGDARRCGVRSQHSSHAQKYKVEMEISACGQMRWEVFGNVIGSFDM